MPLGPEPPSSDPGERNPSAARWPQPAGGRVVLLALLLALLGLAGNLARLPLAFAVDFIFGSVFTLVALVLLGGRWGLLCTLLASLYTWFLWNHPYAILIFTAEAAWVWAALRRGHRILLLIDTLYWALVGIPLVFLFYGWAQHLGLAATGVIALKQAINGVINALLAGVLLRYLPLEQLLGLPRRPRVFPLGAVVFDITLLFLLAPTVGMIYVVSRKEIAQNERALVNQLANEAAQQEAMLHDWLLRHQRAVQAVAELGRRHGLAPSPRLQEELEQINGLFPDFRDVFLADGAARSVAFFPPVTIQGHSAIGLDFSTRPHFIKMRKTLQPVISDVFMAQRALAEPVFVIGQPLVPEGKLAGFAVGVVNLARLRAQLGHGGLPARSLLTLVDARRNIVTTTDPGLTSLAPWDPGSGSHYERITGEVYRWLPPAHRNISVMARWRGARYHTWIPVRGTDWSLVAEIPTEGLQRDSYLVTIWSLAALAGVYLVVLAVALSVSRMISRAPARLADFSRDLPARIEGGEKLEWPETHFEEIAQMTAHFRVTAEALGGRIHQLKEETERRVMSERALIQQSRLAAMGEMIGNIAHQWRQPLNALGMLLANLLDTWRYGQFSEAYLEESALQGDRLIQKMSTTINVFRDFFRPGKAAAAFSARSQVEEALALVGASFRHNGIELGLEPGPEIATLGHANEYSQVLLNLLSNARDAILAVPGRAGRVRITLDRDGDQCRLRVADNGGGVPEELLEHIFEPYFSTKPTSGTGLGLYMARMIIQRNMGGAVTVRNLEEGAEFTVTTPLAEVPDAP